MENTTTEEDTPYPLLTIILIALFNRILSLATKITVILLLLLSPLLTSLLSKANIIMAKSKTSIAGPLLGFISTLLAAAVMAANKQSFEVVDRIFTIRFTDWNIFTTFVIMNSIACFLHFLAIFIPSGTQLWRSFVALDMFMCILLISSWASALTCFELLKYGSPPVGWSPVCSVVHRFCNTALGALIPGFIGFIVSFVFCCFDIHYVLNPLLLPD